MTSRIDECPDAGRLIVPVSVPVGVSAGAGAGLAVRVFDRLLLWLERMRDRRLLSSLDDRMLHDIGVSRYDAEKEARKPFWRR